MKLFSLIAFAAASESEYTTESTTTEEWTTGTTPQTPHFTTETTSVWSTQQYTDCGGYITELQTFSSPGGFGGEFIYPNHAHCVWTIDIRGVPGFIISANRFAVEQAYRCQWDHVKVVANGVERNFCGYNKEQPKTDSEPDKEVDEGDKFSSYGLVNTSLKGFQDLFVLGGQATVSFTTDESVKRQGFEFELIEADRLDIIEYHFGRIVESLPEDASWGERYVNRFYKAFNKAVNSDNGESCYEENGFGSDDSADDVQVFDESDFCKLNGQVNAALNSWARNNACEGRGKVYRQIIRSARKTRNFYNKKMGC